MNMVAFSEEGSTSLSERKKVDRSVRGRIDESGKVLLPIILVASDGLEIEVEALINLQFGGAIVIPEDLTAPLGWRRLGARRVQSGSEWVRMNHYIGMMSLGGELKNVVVLGGAKAHPVLGQRLMAGRKLTVDFQQGTVILE
jgi:predicted aspartyl protease